MSYGNMRGNILKRGITSLPQMLEDYIMTDAADYVPYYMVADDNDVGVGVDKPKFFSFSANNCRHQIWGYMRPAKAILNHKSYIYWHRSGRPLEMQMMQRGDVKLYHSSLFMMYEERGDANVLMAGVVKEENVANVKAILNENDVNVRGETFTKMSSFIEIWIADDFDIVKSRFHVVRNLYRRRVRRRLIEKGLRIIIKPKAEMNELLIRRKVSFATLDLLQTKINSLCQTASTSELSKLASPST